MTRVTKLPCICIGEQVFRNSLNKFPNSIYRVLINTEWNGLERIRIGHARDVHLSIFPFLDFSVVEVRVAPRRIRKFQNPKSIGYGHSPRPLLAPQATHSKILTPDGANTAMAYRRTNSFFPRPLLQSGERTSPRSTIPNHFVTKNPLCNFFPVLSLVTTDI